MISQKKMLEIVDLPDEINDELKSFKRLATKYVWVGPERYYMPEKYRVLGEQILNFTFRPDDVLIVSYPKTGSTWASEMVWLLQNNLDFDTAKRTNLNKRVQYLEYSLEFEPESDSDPEEGTDEKRRILPENISDPVLIKYHNSPSPRIFKTHIPLSLLPSNILDIAKVVYIARDPRDVVVSLHHFAKAFLQDGTELKTTWSFFRRGFATFSPIFSHYKEAWKLRTHPNLIFLKYEDMSQDLPNTLRSLAGFLGKTLSEQDVGAFCDYLHIDSFKKNPQILFKFLKKCGVRHEDMIRKGKVGDWRNHFKGDLEQELEEWIADNSKDFPLYAKTE